MEAVILAAGSQERFGGNKPKCLSRVGGETVVGRLARHLEGAPVTIVINGAWSEQDKQAVARLGHIVEVAAGCRLGESIAAGLRESQGDRVLIYNADNYVLRALPGLSEAGILFDPWEWVTIWCARPGDASAFEKHCIDRVEYMAMRGTRPQIQRLGLINVNTRADLWRARRAAHRGLGI